MINAAIKFSKNYFETLAWQKNAYVIGIDEAGRGCLAGPVVVGAVILPLNTKQPFLKDSKVMSKKERDVAFAWITEHCFWTTAAGSHTEIDALNIYQATLKTMRNACLKLMTEMPIEQQALRYILIDAMPLTIDASLKHPGLSLHHFNYGESLSSSIAAASIVAKVTRDRMMTELDKIFPLYNFAQHKGYGTKEHIVALQTHGPSSIHRKTFIKNFVKNDDTPQQQSLFR
jgi:ribonuclease HII